MKVEKLVSAKYRQPSALQRKYFPEEKTPNYIAKYQKMLIKKRRRTI